MYVWIYVFFPLLEIQLKESVLRRHRWCQCSDPQQAALTAPFPAPVQSMVLSDLHATTYIYAEINTLVSCLNLHNSVFLVFSFVLLLFVCALFSLLVFWGGVSLCRLSIQTSLALKSEIPLPLLRLKAWSTTPGPSFHHTVFLAGHE